MDPRIVIAIALAGLLITPVAIATSSCPYNQAHIGPYNRVEILNDKGEASGYKLVNKTFTVKAIRVETDKTEKPITSTTVNIYFCENNICQGLTKKRMAGGSTNPQGEYSYKPTKLGRYMVECAGKAPMIDIKQLLDQPSDFGAVCGNGICEADKFESFKNCPEDCSVCPNGLCEPGEDRESCPDDCIICGDGICDPPEYWPGGCTCPADCIVCGDNICDSAHNETSSSCEKDCGKNVDTGGFKLEGTNLMIVVGICGAAAAGVVFFLWRRKGKGTPKKKKAKVSYDDGGVSSKSKFDRAWVNPKVAKSKAVSEDEDVEEIIEELMDAGVSDKSIMSKLEEYGLDEDEAEKIIEKAKKKRK